MLSFLFERRYGVLLSRFAGHLADADLLEQARLGQDIAARERVSASIVDFTEVDSVAISPETIAALARLANRKARVFVVPESELLDLVRLYSIQNGFSSVQPPTLAKTREEAYRCLMLQDPHFEPLAIDPAARTAD